MKLIAPGEYYCHPLFWVSVKTELWANTGTSQFWDELGNPQKITVESSVLHFL